MSAILDLLKEFDIAKLMPPMDSFISQLAGWLRLCLLIGPVILAALGAWYYYAPPGEANYSLGYRTKWSMSSVTVWKYAQKLAGKYYMLLGGGLFILMLLISLFFGLFGPIGMAVTALLCIVAEVVLVVLLHVWLDKLLRQKFDQNGDPLKHKR